MTARAALALLAFCLAGSAVAAVRPPPDPRVAAGAFVEACWHGLRDTGRFARIIRESPLRFRLMGPAGGASRYGSQGNGPMTVDMTRGERCVGNLRFFEQANVERFVEEVSRLTGLAVSVREISGTVPTVREYSWPDQAVSGGRMVMSGTATPPDGRPRLEPRGILLSFSASFVAAED